MFVHQHLTLQLAHISHCAVSASAVAAHSIGNELLPSIIGGWQAVDPERTRLLALTATESEVVKKSRLGQSRH